MPLDETSKWDLRERQTRYKKTEILQRQLHALLEGTVTDVSPQVSPVHSLGVALRVPAPEMNPHVSGAGLIRRVRPAVAPSAE